MERRKKRFWKIVRTSQQLTPGKSEKESEEWPTLYNQVVMNDRQHLSRSRPLQISPLQLSRYIGKVPENAGIRY